MPHGRAGLWLKRRRVRYANLIDSPESTMRSLPAFLKEPYTAKCLEPLALRINSSEVPPDFNLDDSDTDPAMIEAAQRLSAEIENALSQVGVHKPRPTNWRTPLGNESNMSPRWR
jgi:hypothetical protein